MAKNSRFRRFAATGVLLAVIAVTSCSGSKGRGPSPSPSTPASLSFVYAPDSPVFFFGTGSDGYYLVLLATKDEQGNPVSVNGFVVGQNDDYVRYEVDALGRPRRAQTPNELLVYSYDDAGVNRYYFAGDHAEGPDPLPGIDASLDYPRVLPLSLEEVPKDTSGLDAQLSRWTTSALKGANDLDKVDQCAAAFGGKNAFWVRQVLDCAGAAKVVSEQVAIPPALQEIIDELNHVKAIVSCAETVSVSSCVTAVTKTINNLGSFAGSSLRELGALGADPLYLEGALDYDRDDAVYVYVSDVARTRGIMQASVDLADIGGPVVALSGNGNRWEARGVVHPMEAGERFVRLMINGQLIGSPTPVVVHAPPGGNPLTVTLDYTPRPARPNDAVVATATPTGGTLPYTLEWFQDGQPAMGDGKTFNLPGLGISKTTTVGVLVTDASANFPRSAMATVSIVVVVCGDGDCEAASAAGGEGGGSGETASPDAGGSQGDSEVVGAGSMPTIGMDSAVAYHASTPYTESFAVLESGSVAHWDTGAAASPLATTAPEPIGLSVNGSTVLFADKTVGFGSGFYGTLTSPLLPGLGDATWVDGDAFRGCLVRTDGHVSCWGTNGVGQLAVPHTTLAVTPDVAVQIPGISDAVKVIVLGANPCVLLRDGTVKCWGAAIFGPGVSPTSEPYTIPNPVPAIDISGDDRLCEVLIDGTVTCLDYNGSAEATWSGLAAKRIHARSNRICVVSRDGLVYCWGFGLPGDGSMNFAATPTLVSGVSNATDVTIGGQQACIRLADGTVSCWGCIVLDSTCNALVPRQVENLSGVR